MVCKVNEVVLNGKPYFGIWFYSFGYFDELVSIGDEKYLDMESKLKKIEIPEGIELIDDLLVFKEGWIYREMAQKASLAYRYLLFGRAFKMMRYTQRLRKK